DKIAELEPKLKTAEDKIAELEPKLKTTEKERDDNKKELDDLKPKLVAEQTNFQYCRTAFELHKYGLRTHFERSFGEVLRSPTGQTSKELQLVEMDSNSYVRDMPGRFSNDFESMRKEGWAVQNQEIIEMVYGYWKNPNIDGQLPNRIVKVTDGQLP